MKLKNLALVASMSILTIGLTGCFEDSSTSESSITIEGASTVKAGNSIALSGSIEGSSAIVDVEDIFTKEGISEAELELVSTTMTGEQPEEGATELDLEKLGVVITTEEEACNGDYTYAVKVTFKDGAVVTSKAHAFTVTDGKTCADAVALTEASAAGMLYNINGKTGETGAFDLIKGEGLASSAAADAKDLLDISVATKGQAGTISSANGAMFVVADSDFDYAKATDKSAAAAYADGDAVETTPVVKVGDVIIVRLSADRSIDYAVLKITKVDASAGASTAGNTGVIEFTYKK